MNYTLHKVTIKEKDILYRLLEYSLYDGSMYINNDIDEEAKFIYPWFDNYFTDDDRDAFIIKDNNKILGMVMVNENLKFLNDGKCIAEFLILPKYRRNHIGKEIAFKVFSMFKGNWEVQPMENNKIAYTFWKNIISEYTNNDYQVKNDGIEDVFIFKSK